MLLGLPMAFQNFIIAIGSMIVQRLINSFGVIFIAGFTATNKLYGVLEIAATSYGFAMVTYTGQNLGANQPKRIREGLKAGVIIALITSTVLGAHFDSFGKTIAFVVYFRHRRRNFTDTCDCISLSFYYERMPANSLCFACISFYSARIR